MSSTLPEASHLTHLWPSLVKRHLALLSEDSDNRPSAFSEVLAKWLFVVHWIEQSLSDDAMYVLSPIVPSRLVTGVLPLSIRAVRGFSVDVVGLWWPVVRVEAIHMCLLPCFELPQMKR